MAKAIIDALSKFPKEAVKTITCDRGSEFACWRDIEKALHCDMYFADPYCAWQKGTNENLNGLLREFYPQRQKPFEGESRNTKKEPGVDQRQAQESFALQNTARFDPRKSSQVLQLV